MFPLDPAASRMPAGARLADPATWLLIALIAFAAYVVVIALGKVRAFR